MSKSKQPHERAFAEFLKFVPDPRLPLLPDGSLVLSSQLRVMMPTDLALCTERLYELAQAGELHFDCPEPSPLANFGCRPVLERELRGLPMPRVIGYLEQWLPKSLEQALFQARFEGQLVFLLVRHFNELAMVEQFIPDAFMVSGMPEITPDFRMNLSYSCALRMDIEDRCS